MGTERPRQRHTFFRHLLFTVSFGILLFSHNAIPNAEPESEVSPEQAGRSETIITREKIIEAHVGEQKRIEVKTAILNVAVTRPEVADAYVVGARDVLVSLNSPGVGKVVVQLEDGTRVAFKLRVYVADPQEFVEELKLEIGHIQGIRIEVVKERILVDGRVLYLKDMDAIERAVGDNPSIINLTSLSSRNARILAREIERELRESGIYGAHAEVRENRVTLVGTLGSTLLVQKAENIASRFTPDFDSLLVVSAKPSATQDRED